MNLLQMDITELNFLPYIITISAQVLIFDALLFTPKEVVVNFTILKLLVGTMIHGYNIHNLDITLRLEN